MNTPTEMTFEIVPESTGLAAPEKESLTKAFGGFFADAERIKEAAEAITDAKEARSARLEIKAVRVAAEKARKALKEDSLRMGRAIDGANNILLSVIVPIERGLDDIEKAEERRIAAELAQKTEDRLSKIVPLLSDGAPIPAVAHWTDDQFEKAMEDATLLRDARVEAERKIEADRVAKEKAEAAERERIRIENEKLKAEAEAREAEIAAENAKRAKAEAAAKRKQAAAAKKLAKEKAEADAKAKAEREAIEAKLKAEQAARAKAEAKARAKEEAERLEKLRIAAEEKNRIAEEKAAAKKAAQAPDKDKLMAFADAVESLRQPETSTENGNAVGVEIYKKTIAFANWIRTQAETL